MITRILFQFSLYSKLSRYASFHLKEMSKMLSSIEQKGRFSPEKLFCQRFLYEVKKETKRNSLRLARQEKSAKHQSVKGKIFLVSKNAYVKRSLRNKFKPKVKFQDKTAKKTKHAGSLLFFFFFGRS